MQENAMMMILYAGNANRYAFEALRKVKTKEFSEARELIAKARSESLQSHKIQSGLLAGFASGEAFDLDILMIHAQDHLMNSVLAIDLIEEMIDVFENYQ